LNKIPGLANIPILGNLFKTRSRTKNKSELVVLVTPEEILPYNPADPKPFPTFEYKGVPDSNPGLRDLTKSGPPVARP